jgi:hypothetical protein
VSPGLVATAVLVVAAAVTCICSRDARLRFLALATASLLVPVVADPLPDAMPLAARLAAILLGLFAIWVSIRVRPVPEPGTDLGRPVTVLVAATAFVAGLASLVPIGERPGPLVAQAAGLALVALAMAPVAAGRGAIRMGCGLLLLLDGAEILSNALGGTPAAGGQVVAGLLFSALAGGVAVLRIREVRVGVDLDVAEVGPGELAGPPAR